MRLNLYSALTILGIVLFVASVAAILFLIGIADYLYGSAFMFFSCIAASALLSSVHLMQIAAANLEPIITRILDVIECEEND